MYIPMYHQQPSSDGSLTFGHQRRNYHALNDGRWWELATELVVSSYSWVILGWRRSRCVLGPWKRCKFWSKDVFWPLCSPMQSTSEAENSRIYYTRGSKPSDIFPRIKNMPEKKKFRGLHFWTCRRSQHFQVEAPPKKKAYLPCCVPSPMPQPVNRPAGLLN